MSRRFRISLGQNALIRPTERFNQAFSGRLAQQRLYLTWLLQTMTMGSRTQLDYFANYQYDHTTNSWKVRDNLWVVDENPPVFWVFHPNTAQQFRFDLYNSDSNWTKGSLVETSGWQTSAVWYLTTPLSGQYYILEVRYREGNKEHRLINNDAIRVFVPNNTPVVSRITASQLRALFETYPEQTIDTGLVRRSVFAQHLTAIRNKYAQAAANQTTYPITYHVINRVIDNIWNSSTSVYGKTRLTELVNRQLALENAVDTNQSYTDPDIPESHGYIYIFDLRNEYNTRAIINRNGFYEGFSPYMDYIFCLLIVAVFHPLSQEREASYHLLRVFIRTVFERVLQTPQGQLSDDSEFANPDNTSFGLMPIALVYDLLFHEQIENDSFTIKVFGTPMPIKRAIPDLLQAFLRQRYFPSEYYRSNGAQPEEIAILRPFESHRHRNHTFFFLIMLVLNQLMGWNDWESRVRRELKRLYATFVPWALSDNGYNEGYSYMTSYLRNWSNVAFWLQLAGIPCHQIRRVAKSAYEMIYQVPFGTQEFVAGDGFFLRSPLYFRDASDITNVLVALSAFLTGTNTAPGVPEGQLFRNFAISNNYNGIILPHQSGFASSQAIRGSFPIILSPNINHFVEDNLPSLPMNNIPNDMISKKTKFAYILTDVKTDQREDTPTNRSKLLVRFFGQRLLRQSHMRNTVNDIQILAGGEHIIGFSCFGYNYTAGALQNYAYASISYTTPVLLPQGSSSPVPNEPANQWRWHTTYNNIPIRLSQRRINQTPTVSLTEMLVSEGTLTHSAQTISRWVYLENDAFEKYEPNWVNSVKRRVVVLPDMPIVVVLDEVNPKLTSSLLWSWYGWNYLYDYDPNIPTGTNLQRNRSPFFDLQQSTNNVRVRVNGNRTGANYWHFGSPDHIEHLPRMAGVFGALGDPNFTTLFLRGKIYRPFEEGTIYRYQLVSNNQYQEWGGEQFNGTNLDRRNVSSVPHPLAVWLTSSNTSTHMNDSVDFLPANQTYRAVFWCVPYRIRSVDGNTNIPNAHTNNDWIAHRNETLSEVQIGVFNNAPSAKYGVIVKFRKSGYTETNAVSLEYVPNQSAWDSFTSMQSG